MKYNQFKLDRIGKLLTSTLAYIIFFITVLMVYHNSIPVPYYLLGIPVILVYYDFIQTYCHQLFIYILLHAGCLLPVCLIPFPYVEYRYLYCIMLCFEIVQAMLMRRQNADKTYANVSWNLLVGVCLTYMIVFGSNQSGLAKMIYSLGMVVIIIYFIRFFLEGLTKIFSATAQTTSIPVKAILLNVSYLFLFFILIFALSAMVIQYGNLGIVLENIMKLLALILFYIFSTIIAFFTSDNQPVETQKAKRSITHAVSELSEPSFLAQIMEVIFIIAGMCLAVYCMYMVIKWLIQMLVNRYSKDMDTIIQLNKPDDTTKEVNKMSVVEQVREFFKGDNASKIRRSYRSKIRSYKSLIYQDCDTPSELAERIDEDYNENIHELTTIYEKARYSNEEITSADVKKVQMKNFSG